MRADQWHRALVPDSSVIHPEDPSFDGKREVHACGPAHLDELIQGARKQWSDEQLWFGRLARASTMPGMRVVSLRRVGDRARLTEEALDRALAWNARRADPDTTLPGGQRLPTTRPESN
ncbi:MAG TPA: hypothetical protein VG756_30780 [Pseudonocardiaceae bacterium]|nr:hypothetical protein [Pseudonocardiaceae bacterium]